MMVEMVEGGPSAGASLEASAAMRARFELLVVRERTWKDGIAAATTDLVERALAQPALARAVVNDSSERGAELSVRRRDRGQWVDMLIAAWKHHHSSPPPECQLEFFFGALRRVIAWSLEYEDTPARDELRMRLRTLQGFVATETHLPPS
ncbi:MAG TPA: hypothetical protein VFG42_24905 [Baekduia sp.]|uniref:hypothetical protein n=1 Tax=Baekduia sp. TaxID=2600305 RepID=UPI002D782126|nr:hypothetical protein [Baekduia sp.]HET6510057.1 hypothetical protein [Baekduia sp.]